MSVGVGGEKSQKEYAGVLGLFESLRLLHDGTQFTAPRVILNKYPWLKHPLVRKALVSLSRYRF